MPDPSYFIPLRQAIPFLPENILLSPDGDSVLDSIGLTDFDIIDEIDRTTINLSVAFANELVLALPGLEAFELVVGSDSSSQLNVEVDVFPELAVRLVDTTVRLRLQQDLLRPVELDSENRWVVRTAPSGDPLPFEISLEGLQFSANSEGQITFDISLGAGEIDVPAFMIAESGVVVEVESIAFHFSDDNPPLNYPPGTRGISIDHASIHLPDGISVALPSDLELENLFIGSSGFSGRIQGEWSPTFKADRSGFEGNGAGSIVDLAFALKRLALEFRDSALVASETEGSLLVPYFEEPVDIKINLGSSGDFTVALQSNDEDGIQLNKEELFALNIKSLSVSRNEDVGAIAITGGLEPLLMSSDGLQWPRLDVKDLYIDSTGKFSIKEAWLDLKDLATLDLWGFHFELRRIGIGSEERSDGDRLWVDLSGGLRLIEQIPVALDVEGFRLTWPQSLLTGLTGPPTLDEIQNAVSQIEVEFAGIYLFFGVPDAVEFEGLIRFFKDPQIVGFAGDMALRVPASGFGAEAGLLIGLSFDPPFPFLYVYFGVDLPAGIPLGQSGLALKGAQGMFGLNVGPDKDPDQNWYYDWYKRGPIVGAHPTNKWKPMPDALALGVGVTITTTDGYVKGTRGLIVLAIPGPILIIEGRALILSGLQPAAEPPLRALAVFDGDAGTVQFNIEAEAILIADLLKAYGMLEAFFDFNDLTNWHIYLGQDTPRDRRIRADILKLDNSFLFKADAYLMIDMVGADTLRSRIGVSIGFEPDVPDIDPLKVDFAATLAGDGLATARPEQFSGEVDLDAHIKLSALGVSLRLSADARFLTEGPSPLKVGAHVSVKAEMPAPLDPVEATIEFEWEAPRAPVVEAPLSEIAVSSRFVPDGGGFREHAIEPKDEFVKVDSISDLTNGDWEIEAKRSPIVPVDSQPIIGFKQRMNSTVTHFARHPDGVDHHYDVGLFHFQPSLTTVKLYEHPKRSDDEWFGDARDWDTASVDADMVVNGELIASTDPDDEKPLPGVWLVESQPESPEAPSPRRIQLWTDNPLSSSARALGSGYRQFQGAIQPGKPLAERLRDDYPDLMQCTHTKVEFVCVDFKAAGNVVIEPGDSWDYQDLRFESTFKTATVRGDGDRGSVTISGDTIGFINSIVELFRRTLGRIVDNLLRRTAEDTCLFVDGYIDIHFRERVKKVRIILCQPSKLPSEAIRVRVTARRGIRSGSELNESRGNGGKTITLADLRACNVRIAAELTVSDQEWLFEADEGFDCLNIVRMDEFAIREICYTTVAEVERSRLATEQCQNNSNPPGIGRTLRPGAYYRLDVITKVTGDLFLEDMPFSRYSTIGKMLEDSYNWLVEELTGNNLPFDWEFYQTCFFQTEGPPTSLRPYVKWVYPEHQSERFFYGDNLSIRFLRSNLRQMFQPPFDLKIQIRDAEGKIVDGYQTIWRKARSVTLFPEESVWQEHRTTLDWPNAVTPQDDILLVELLPNSDGRRLLPGSRYQLEVAKADSTDDEAGYWYFVVSYGEEDIKVTNAFFAKGTAVTVYYMVRVALNGFRGQLEGTSFATLQEAEQDRTANWADAQSVSIPEALTAVLFSSSFVTSKFESFKKLAASYSGEPKLIVPREEYPSALSSVAEIQQSTRVLARARWNWEHAEVDFRFELLKDGRKGLEQARLALREAGAAHDDKFRALAESLADLYFQPVSDSLEVYLLRDPNRNLVIGAWIRSPENLDLRLDVVDDPNDQQSERIDHVGRTEIKLQRKDAANLVNPIITIQNADCTQVLIIPAPGRRWRRRKYSFVLTYHRDYGDETRNIEHRYDRPIEHLGGNSEESHKLEWSGE